MTQQRITVIRKRLESVLDVKHLEIIDESDKHIGHAGAQGGMGHFKVTIIASEFMQKPTIQRHRLIYQVLGDLMQTDIHALRITASAPDSA